MQLGGVGHTLTGRVERNPTDKLVFYGSMNTRETHGLRPPRGWRGLSTEEKRQYVRDWRDSREGEPFKEEVRNYEFPVQPDGTLRTGHRAGCGRKCKFPSRVASNSL